MCIFFFESQINNCLPNMLLSEAMNGQDTYALPAIFPVNAPGIIVTLYSLAALTIALNSFSKSFTSFVNHNSGRQITFI